MTLLGTPFLVAVVGLSVLVLVGAAVLWDRWPSAAAWPLRLASLALVMGVGVALTGTFVNRRLGFYATLGELTGHPAAGLPTQVRAPTATADDAVLDPGWRASGRIAAEQGRGTVVSVRRDGPRSRISRTGLVYLPAAWFLADHPHLPVVELLHGFPGIPQNLRDQLHVGDVLDREIAAHRMPPVIAVAPKTYDGRASECVDAGPRRMDETYLVADVPATLHRLFGSRLGRSLGLVGYSEGGFCAVDLGLHHPATVAADVSLAGYFTAGTDPHTMDLYRHRPGLREHDSPLAQVRRCSPSGPPTLVVASRGDRDAVAEDDALRRAAALHDPRLPLSAAELPVGGHNFGTFGEELAGSLDFLGRHLPSTLTAPLLLPAAPPIVLPRTSRPAATLQRSSGPGLPGRPGLRRRTPAVTFPSWCSQGFPSTPSTALRPATLLRAGARLSPGAPGR